jgi:hypothetical protein
MGVETRFSVRRLTRTHIELVIQTRPSCLLAARRLRDLTAHNEREKGTCEVLRNPRKTVLICCLIAIFNASCAGPQTGAGSSAIRDELDLKRVLSWLPADTETLLVANGPFWMSNFQIGGENYKNHAVTSEDVEKTFEGLTLGLFNSKNFLLEKHLEGKKVLFALEGSRHFRPPAGLGEMPFEGCALAIFKDDLGDRRDAFMRDATQFAVRIEEIEGQKVAEFEERSEQDILTTFVTFPRVGVVLVATNKQFLLDMLARIGGAEGERALPDTLPEWKYVNKQAKFWGFRHFDKRQSNEDPTSPFGGRKSANMPDDEAIGLTYQCDPSHERKATLTYLSGPRAEIRKIEESRFPSSSEPEATAGLNIQYRDLQPGVIQSIYDLKYSRSLDWFFFVFMENMGHAIYL